MRLISLKDRWASLHTVITTPQIFYIQYIKLRWFYLLYQLAFAANIYGKTKQANLKHLFSQQSFTLINAQGSPSLADRAGLCGAVLLLTAGLGSADLGSLSSQEQEATLGIFLMATAEAHHSR